MFVFPPSLSRNRIWPVGMVDTWFLHRQPLWLSTLFFLGAIFTSPDVYNTPRWFSNWSPNSILWVCLKIGCPQTWWFINLLPICHNWEYPPFPDTSAWLRFGMDLGLKRGHAWPSFLAPWPCLAVWPRWNVAIPTLRALFAEFCCMFFSKP